MRDSNHALILVRMDALSVLALAVQRARMCSYSSGVNLGPAGDPFIDSIVRTPQRKPAHQARASRRRRLITVR